MTRQWTLNIHTQTRDTGPKHGLNTLEHSVQQSSTCHRQVLQALVINPDDRPGTTVENTPGPHRNNP